MKTLFDIGSEKEISGEHTLLLEVGKDYCCTAFFHKTTNTIDRILLTSFDEFEIDRHLPSIIAPLGGAAFGSVVACSAFPQALLFPNKYFKNEYTSLDLIYDQPAQEYFHDSIPEWQIVNVYSLPQVVSSTIKDAFPSVQYLHSYTPSIKIYNGYVADNQLSVHFTEQYFRVLLKVETAICLAQTYYYKTPLDVIYYLLKICYEFHLSQQDIFLVLSGLVAKDSNLFTDIQQYFINIHFAQQPEISLPQSSHPHYFFTSIYNLAACVS